MTPPAPQPLPDGKHLIWQGRVYRGSSQGRDQVVLLTPTAEPGFEPRAVGGGFRRTVPRSEVQVVRVETRASWRGEPFVVTASTAEELTLRYVGNSAPRARALGMTELERGVFQTTVPRSEVTDVEQVRSSS